MSLSKTLGKTSAYVLLCQLAFVIASTDAFAQTIQRGTAPSQPHSDLVRVPDEVLAQPVHKMFSSTTGATTTSVINSPTVRVYENIVDSGYARLLSGAGAGGVPRPDGSETGAFIADNLTLTDGFAVGGKIHRYSLRIWRPDTGAALERPDVHVALWDVDPGHWWTVEGARGDPIAGSEADFFDVPPGQLIDLVVEIPDGLVLPNQRVWMMLTSNGCDVGWMIAGDEPSVGRTDIPIKSWMEAVDADGVGRCCDDGSPCDHTDADAENDCPSGITCGDGVAETLGVYEDPDGVTPSGLVATIEAAGLALSQGALFRLTPVSCDPPGFCIINGNEVFIPDPTIQPNRIFLELDLSGWSTVNGTCSDTGESCQHGVDCDYFNGATCEGGPERLHVFQVTWDSSRLTNACGSGLSMDDQHPCDDYSDCAALLGAPIGCRQGRCLAAFQDVSREDWLYASNSASSAVDTAQPDYRMGAVGALTGGELAPFSDGTTRYGGTFIITVPPDAAGEFSLGFHAAPEQGTFMLDQYHDVIPLIGIVPAIVKVRQADLPAVEPYALADTFVNAPKNRYLTFIPQLELSGAVATAISVRFEDMPGPDDCEIIGDFSALEGQTMWVGEEVTEEGTGNPTGVYSLQNEPLFRNWSAELPLVCVGATGVVGATDLTIGESTLCVDADVEAACISAGGTCEPLLVVSDCNIVPCATYSVQSVAEGVAMADDCFPEALTLSTTMPGSVCPGGGTRWADIVGPFDPNIWRYAPADGCMDFRDIEAVFARFKNATKAPPKSWCDLVGTSDTPHQPNGGLALNVDMLDVQAVVSAFRGGRYTDSISPPTGRDMPCGHGACCSVVLCSISTFAECTEAGGTYLGDGVLCEANVCE